MDNFLEKIKDIHDCYLLQIDDYNIETPWGKSNPVLDRLEDLIAELTPKKESSMLYPASITETAEGFSISLRDVPEVEVEGTDIEDTLLQASIALSFAIDGYYEKKEKRPFPSPLQHGDLLVYYHLSK